jgi:hypothetical protein
MEDVRMEGQRLHTRPDGTQHVSVQLCPAPPQSALGQWSAWPEALSAVAALERELAAALGGAMRLVSSAVTELKAQTFDDKNLLRRAVLADGLRAAPRHAPWSFTFENDPEMVTSAYVVLLTHAFAPCDGDGDDGIGAPPWRVMTLTTCVRLCNMLTPRQLADALPEGARCALQSEDDDSVRALDPTFGLPMHHMVITTDVALDGASLSSKALAALPSAVRACVRAARKAQHVSTLRDCVRARWPGGFYLLRKVAAAHLSIQLRTDTLDPLAVALQTALARAGAGYARQQGGVTVALVNSRRQQAEALEAGGRYQEAAALYRQNLVLRQRAALDVAMRFCFRVAHTHAYRLVPQTDDMRAGAGTLIPSPAMEWSYLGLALRRGDDLAGARSAYESGLRALAAPSVREVLDQRYNESCRLNLLYMCITALPIPQPQQEMIALVARLFGDERMARLRATEAAAAPGGPTSGRINYHAGFERVSVDGLFSGSGYALTRVQKSSYAVVEVPPGAPVPPVDLGSNVNAEYADEAAALLRRQQRGAAPALPLRACAGCGANARGMPECSGCLKVVYCSAACQKLHWKAHRRDCKATKRAA